MTARIAVCSDCQRMRLFIPDYQCALCTLGLAKSELKKNDDGSFIVEL